jgi:cytoskeletal protein RodZ
MNKPAAKPSFPGGELCARREALGLGVDDVYRRIRIAPAFLRAIEAGDFSAIPAGCYALGFLKTYCALLDLDPHRFLDAYHACTKPSNRFLRRSPSNKIILPDWLSELATWAAVCAIILLGWAAYSVVVHPSAAPGEQRVHAGAVDNLVVPSAPVDLRQ